VEENMSKIATRGLGSAAARNLKFVLVPALLACTSLTGCAGGGIMSAAPIDFASLGTPPPASDKPGQREYLGRVVLQSEQNCSNFLSALTGDQAGTNTFLDIAATTASALSTAITVQATKSALSAASSIASGSKTAIDTDVFAKAAASDFATAIQGTYGKDIVTYTDNLEALPDSFLVSNEEAKIQSYHAECSLAAAESAIANKIAPTKNPPPPPPSPPNGNGGVNPEGLPPPPPPGTTEPTEPPAKTRAAIPGRGDW
jgi:hypothetical protein